MVLTVYSALSLVNRAFCHHPRREAPASSPSWRQHRGVRTTRLRRPRQALFVSQRPRVHRIPHPTSV